VIPKLLAKLLKNPPLFSDGSAFVKVSFISCFGPLSLKSGIASIPYSCGSNMPKSKSNPPVVNKTLGTP